MSERRKEAGRVNGRLGGRPRLPGTQKQRDIFRRLIGEGRELLDAAMVVGFTAAEARRVDDRRDPIRVDLQKLRHVILNDDEVAALLAAKTQILPELVKSILKKTIARERG